MSEIKRQVFSISLVEMLENKYTQIVVGYDGDQLIIDGVVSDDEGYYEHQLYAGEGKKTEMLADGWAWCVLCGANKVRVVEGYDTCGDCLKKM